MESTKAFFEAMVLSILDVPFELMEFLSSTVPLFLRSFVLCSLCSLFNLSGSING